MVSLILFLILLSAVKCNLQPVPVLFSLLTFFPLQHFLQSLKILLRSRFPKDKNGADFSKNALQRQEEVKPKDLL